MRNIHASVFDLSKRLRYPEGFIQLLLRHHCSGSQDLALDLATGTGFLADILSDEFKKVLALDISSTQIEVA